MGWTPLPESTGEKLESFAKGPLLLTVWRLFLLLVIGTVVLVLIASGGFFGLLIAGLLVMTLIRQGVRDAIRDLWHLRFWRVE